MSTDDDSGDANVIDDPASYVNGYIGTLPFPESPGGYMDQGMTFLGAAVPQGMVQLGPDTLPRPSNSEKKGCAYRYDNDVVQGFSHTHLSGPWPKTCGNFLVAATTGEVTPMPNDIYETDEDHPQEPVGYASSFDHETETVEPGYYAVDLEDYGVRAELTATTRTGSHRYTFPEGEDSNVLIDVTHNLAGRTPEQASVRVADERTITGSVTIPDPFALRGEPYTIHFYARFAEPFDDHGTWTGEDVAADERTADGEDVGAYVRYDESTTEVRLDVGVSYVSVDNARENLETELDGRDFETVRADAYDAWNDSLRAIEVGGGAEDDLVKFYTALYHALLNPVTFSDANGEYVGMDDEVHTADGYTSYHMLSLADWFRQLFPLLTVIEPKVANDVVRSLVDAYEEGGWMPRWKFANSYTNTMLASPEAPVVATAFLKGIRDYDVEAAYEGLRKNATEKPSDDEYFVGRNHHASDPGGPDVIPAFEDLGYVPSEAGRDPVSLTLEFAFHDWTLAQIARELGESDDYERFSDRAANWINTFDPETKWPRPRNADGSWNGSGDPVDPTGFTEGNAWTTAWFVPHDVPALVEFMGEDRFVERLDHTFSEFRFAGFEDGEYYYQGNQFEQQRMPFLYNDVGQPWKTQRVVQEVIDAFYGTDPGGLPGNDDLGSMSAWLVWAAIGLFPVTPGKNGYAISSPIFDRVTVHLPEYHYGGREFVIETRGSAADAVGGHRYITEANVNGDDHDEPWLDHEDLASGGNLRLTMRTTPDEEWGADSEPP